MLDYIKYIYESFLVGQTKANCHQSVKVIFKADDLTSCNDKVKKVDDIVQENGICISWGIIGNSLENPNNEYINFLKTKSSDKKYHFFNHGYYHLEGEEELGYEFDGQNVDTQMRFMKATQDIVKEKVGIVLDTFGAPCNHIDNNTPLVLDKIPEIRYWYYGNEDSAKLNIKRTIEIENGVGNPKFKFFKRNFETLLDKPELLTLQIHPNAWNKAHFLEFILCVEYLKKCGCKFINPSDIKYQHSVVRA